MSTTRKSYPRDVTDVEWEFLLPYLTLMREDAAQREYTLRDLFDAMRYVVKTGCQPSISKPDVGWQLASSKMRRPIFAR